MIRVKDDKGEREISMEELTHSIATRSTTEDARVLSKNVFGDEQWHRLGDTRIWSRLKEPTTSRRTKPVRMSKALYLSGYIICSVSAFFMGYIGIVARIIWLAMTHEMWSAMKGHRQVRATPGKAVGYLFIPFYNLYWIFNAYAGFATDYNAIVQEATSTSLGVLPRLSRSLYIAQVLFFLATVLTNIPVARQGSAGSEVLAIVALMVAATSLVLDILVMNCTIGAVNALADGSGDSPVKTQQ